MGRANRGTVTEYGLGDDDFYWSYGRRLVYEQNFSFQNEPLRTFTLGGDSRNVASPVPGILWSPAVALGRFIGPLLPRLSVEGSQGCEMGISSLQRLIVSAFSSALTLAGLFFFFSFLKSLFPEPIAFLASVLTLWAGPLLFFTFRRPLMSHSAEYFLLGLSAWITLRFIQRPRLRVALVTGIVLMAGVLVRYPNGLTIGAIGLGLFLQFEGWKKFKPVHYAGLGCGLALVLALQFFLWHSIHGKWFPLTSGVYDVSSEGLSLYLGISSRTVTNLLALWVWPDWGLLWTEPAILLGVGGMCLPNWRYGKLRLCLAVALIPSFLIAANFGSQGGSYGYRYLLVKAMWLAVACALFLESLGNRKRTWALVTGCCLAAIIPFLLYATGPAELTLALGPTRRPPFEDWVNPSFILNAWKAFFREPQLLLFALSGAPFIHLLLVGSFSLGAASFLPAAVVEKALLRVSEVPSVELVWFMGWQVVFALAVWWLVKKPLALTAPSTD